MATKARKSGKSKSTPSNGDTRKSRASKTGGDGDTQPEASGAEDTSERLEKRIEARLSRIEDKLGGPRKKAGKPGRKRNRKAAVDDDVAESVAASDPMDEPEEDTDSSAIAVKRLRRRASDPAAYPESDESDEYGEPPGDRVGDLIDRVLSFLPGSKSREYERIIDTLERMDEFGKAPELDKRLEAVLTFLYDKYWRVEASGLEHIPDEGRTLIVANHSGVLPFDGAMMGTAIFKHHPARRYPRFLIEDWFGQLPFATEFMNAVGQVRACQENAERLLRQEQLVGVFPEGLKGMAKGFKDRYHLARFGRGGVIRLAIRTRSPVVPCAVVGAEEIYVVLGYANWLGKMFGMPLLPITATFPWLGPFGMVPMPTKWSIQFGEMISYDEYDDSALKDNVIINRLNRQLRATIQEMLDSMLKKRRSLFF